LSEKQNFINNSKSAINALKTYAAEKLIIIFHDDADGLTSAAIIKVSLEREGFKPELICIERLCYEVMESLHEKQGNIYFYVDIGAAHGGYLSKINNSKNLVIILDHHDATPAIDPLIYNLDPELYGVSGETDVSGSSTTYIFSKILNEKNVELAHLAVIGSAEIPGPIRGWNEEALMDAIKQDLVEVKSVKAGEDYIVKKPFTRPVSFREASTTLTVLGAVGYYRKGPEMGINGCINGFTEKLERIAEELEHERKIVNKKLLGTLYREGLKQMKNIQWFHAGDAFKGMGVKTIGTFCSYIRFQRFVHPEKYLIGFMNMEKNVPGFGLLRGDYVKVSARAPAKLEPTIKSDDKPPLSRILPEAAKIVGGLADGHSVAASGIIPKGTEEELLKRMDEMGSYRK
jgi:RecJ-like exonuclease